MTCAICPNYGFCVVQTERSERVNKFGWYNPMPIQFYFCKRLFKLKAI